MKIRLFTMMFLGIFILSAPFLVYSAIAAENGGEAGFKKNCAVCHPGGSNIINPKKTLHSRDLKANNITRPQDIVRKMRNPGPGMTKFSKSTIPDKEAREIAEYVLKTFK